MDSRFNSFQQALVALLKIGQTIGQARSRKAVEHMITIQPMHVEKGPGPLPLAVIVHGLHDSRRDARVSHDRTVCQRTRVVLKTLVFDGGAC